MSNESLEKASNSTLRETIEDFISERLKPKLEVIEKNIEREEDIDKKRDLEEKRQKLLGDYQREAWLEDAAKRASQIQLVTHTSKHIHPKSRGSSLYAGEVGVPKDEVYVGTHTLEAKHEDDVVGNAAALDVYKFLSVEYRGKTLIDLVRTNDSEIVSAFSDNSEKANAWMVQFAAITDGSAPVASHALTKQLYFPLSAGAYHLLAPLYPTSLVHFVYKHLREARFSEDVKLAREARKEGKAFESGYKEYPSIAVQTFGGTKPQNVSQLNSQRSGESWLLPSLPPNWESAEVNPPLKVRSVFGRWFGNRQRVRELTKVLAKFLASTEYNNVKIRQKRAEFIGYLKDELLHFSAELYGLEPGWTADSECRLDRVEALWLDPERAEIDEDFGLEYRKGDWQREVASRFGNWLNSELRYHSKLPLGEAEYSEWVRVIEPVINSVGEELAYD